MSKDIMSKISPGVAVQLCRLGVNVATMDWTNLDLSGILNGVDLTSVDWTSIVSSAAGGLGSAAQDAMGTIGGDFSDGQDFAFDYIGMDQYPADDFGTTDFSGAEYTVDSFSVEQDQTMFDPYEYVDSAPEYTTSDYFSGNQSYEASTADTGNTSDSNPLSDKQQEALEAEVRKALKVYQAAQAKQKQAQARVQAQARARQAAAARGGQGGQAGGGAPADGGQGPHKVALPVGWEQKLAADGRTYYMDHVTRTTHWHPPKPANLKAALPQGWQEGRAKDGRTFYIDHTTRTTHWALPPVVSPAINRPLPAQAPGGIPGLPPRSSAAPPGLPARSLDPQAPKGATANPPAPPQAGGMAVGPHGTTPLLPPRGGGAGPLPSAPPPAAHDDGFGDRRATGAAAVDAPQREVRHAVKAASAPPPSMQTPGYWREFNPAEDRAGNAYVAAPVKPVPSVGNPHDGDLYLGRGTAASEPPRTRDSLPCYGDATDGAGHWASGHPPPGHPPRPQHRNSEPALLRSPVPIEQPVMRHAASQPALAPTSAVNNYPKSKDAALAAAITVCCSVM